MAARDAAARAASSEAKAAFFLQTLCLVRIAFPFARPHGRSPPCKRARLAPAPPTARHSAMANLRAQVDRVLRDRKDHRLGAGGAAAEGRARGSPRLKLFFDGGCRPNPGPIEVAVVVRGVACFFDDLGSGTSSEAEWLALRLALQVAQSLGEQDFELIGDCAQVIDQAAGLSRCRTPAALHHRSRYEESAAAGRPARLRWIRRSQNLAGIALERRHERF